MDLTLRVWRQTGPGRPGAFEEYRARGISPDASFLEMLDVVNERLTMEDRQPITFEHDCREGICGCCGIMINGKPHGGEPGTATCQLHMRKFSDGEVIVVEPWRAAGFPVLKDLMVDRSALDRIIEAGGYIGIDVGSAPEANLTPVPKPAAELAMDAAACIGCGACVAACPNNAALALHRSQGRPPQPPPAGPGRALFADRGHGRHHGTVLRLVHQPRRV